jgi:hypothetical protein
MSANEQRIIPFTIRSFIVIGLLISALTGPLWWPRLRGGSAPAAMSEPDLSGGWVGTAHITSYAEGYNPATPLDEQATFSLNLQMYDGFLKRYRGQGTFRIGDELPRDVKVTGLSLDPKPSSTPESAKADPGGFRLEANLRGDLLRDRPSDSVTSIQGSASSDRIQFTTVATMSGYVFQVDLHRNGKPR